MNKSVEQQRRRVIPASSIREEEGKVVLVLEMPGIGKGEVSIRVENDELQIFAKRDPAGHEGKYLLKERTLADYYSSYTLDETIDRDRIEAETSLGLLTITMHLTEASKPRQITVKEVR
jgi:HSP20 family protein